MTPAGHMIMIAWRIVHPDYIHTHIEHTFFLAVIQNIQNTYLRAYFWDADSMFSQQTVKKKKTWTKSSETI